MGEFDEVDPPQLSLERLTGLLWNCPDVIPSDVRKAISELVDVCELESDLVCDEQPPIFTVAQACRWLRPNLGGVLALIA
jgi:hypothetical protein